MRSCQAARLPRGGHADSRTFSHDGADADRKSPAPKLMFGNYEEQVSMDTGGDFQSHTRQNDATVGLRISALRPVRTRRLFIAVLPHVPAALRRAGGRFAVRPVALPAMRSVPGRFCTRLSAPLCGCAQYQQHDLGSRAKSHHNSKCERSRMRSVVTCALSALAFACAMRSRTRWHV